MNKETEKMQAGAMQIMSSSVFITTACLETQSTTSWKMQGQLDCEADLN